MGAVTHGDVLAGRARPEELVPFGGPQAHKAFALAAGVELLVGARPRQGAAAHVVAHVEVGVVHPDGVGQAAGHAADPLPVARDVGDALADQCHEALVVETAGRGVEHHDRPDVHRGRRVLEVEEGGVE